MTRHGIRKEVLSVLRASAHALTAAQIAAILKHDPAAMKYIMCKLTKDDLVHVVGSKRIYGGRPNLYLFGPSPQSVMTGAAILAQWQATVKAKLEQRA